MFIQLSVATILVMMTVMIHGFGLAVLSRVLRGEAQEEREHHVPALSFRALAFTLLLVGALFFLHGIEIWLYAAFYDLAGAVSGLETSVYFSTISYSAIGYSDHYINPAWRLVAAVEGINGLLLLGWSTAFFVTMHSRLGRS